MNSQSEYHKAVRRSSSVAFALVALLAAPVLVSNSHAQINGAPASVTSPGFGGHAINGVAPSVTSVGPRGYAPGGAASFSTGIPYRNDFHHHGDGHNNHSDHRQNEGGYVVPYLYAVPYPVPYATDMSGNSGYTDDEDEYQGGPTIFDRRGSGADSYVPPLRNIPPRPTADTSNVPPAPEEPQEPTVLVFKDGHTTEVGNYAIVGATLFDLSPGHRQKVAIADLDLDATQKQNDERGVNFRLPASSQAD